MAGRKWVAGFEPVVLGCGGSGPSGSKDSWSGSGSGSYFYGSGQTRPGSTHNRPIDRTTQDVDRFILNPELASTSMRSWLAALKRRDILQLFDALAFFQLKQKMNLVHLERNKVDARIERISFVVQSLSDLFKRKSGLDYRHFLFPLIRSFLKEKLQASDRKR